MLYTKDIRNYLIGIFCIIIALLYWLFLKYCINLDIFATIIEYFDIFDNVRISYGVFYPICFALLYYIIHYLVDNELQAFVKYIPKVIDLNHKHLILKQVKNIENTYSLQTCFQEIDIDYAFDTDDIVLSLNGLVGDKNKEEVSTDVSDEQISRFLDTIRRWQDGCGGINKKNIHILDDSELADYSNIFTTKIIRDNINSVRKDIEGKDNTFNFIGDKFGVFSAQKGKGRSLVIKIYKTNYFTFCVMNTLYSHTPLLQSIAKRMCESEDKTIQKEGYLLLFPFFSSLGANIIIEILSESKGEGFLIQKRSPKSFGKASQYHISVNEAFSFTDFDDGKPDFSKCVQRGIEEELGLNIERLDRFKKTAHQRIQYLDFFLNSDRGSLGISLVYNTDVNPSLITYYPGMDKVIESSKHICVFGVKNYFQMTNFLSLYNWISYTPYLLKRYSIIKEGGLNNFRTTWLLGSKTKSIFSRMLLYRISVIIITIISIYYGIYVENSMASLLCTPIISLYFSMIIDYYKKLKRNIIIRNKNADYVSLGSFPYKNALLYTGDRKLEDKDIVLTLKTHICLSADEIKQALCNSFCYDFEDISKVLKTKKDKTIELKKTDKISWNNISIVNYRTGIRRVSDDNEIPSLFLTGFLSQQEQCQKLIVREYKIDNRCNTIKIYYKREDNKETNTKGIIKFGYDHPFSTVFKIVDGIDILANSYRKLSKKELYQMVSEKKFMSSFAVEQFEKKGYNYFCHLKVHEEMNGIDLCDVYQSSDGGSIIISSKRNNTMIDTDKETDYIEGTEKEICEQILNLKKNYTVDEQDILMLQQILIRNNINLFYKPN